MKLKLVALIMLIPLVGTAEEVSLSTDGMIPISYTENGTTSSTTDGLAPRENGHYVTISVPKVRISKQNSIFDKIISSNKTAFASAKLSGKYAGADFQQIKISPTKVLSKTDNIVDMGMNAIMLPFSPWRFDSLTLECGINQASDSNIQKLADSIANVSSAVPDVTISASITAATQVAKIVDKFLFSDGRSTSLLKGSKDIDTKGDDLKHGYYVVFAANKSTEYSKYKVNDSNGKPKLTWDTNNQKLNFDGKEIIDTTYFIIKIGVTAERYKDSELTTNPVTTAKAWGKTYKAVITRAELAAMATTKAEVEKIRDEVTRLLIEALTLVTADDDLTSNEQLRIHKAFVRKYLDEIRKLAANTNGTMPLWNIKSASDIQVIREIQANRVLYNELGTVAIESLMQAHGELKIPLDVNELSSLNTFQSEVALTNGAAEM